MLIAERVSTKNLALNQLARRTEADRIRLENLMRLPQKIDPQDFDFLVVMGTVSEINNQPNPAFLARTQKAYRIWQVNQRINIIPSGGCDHRFPTEIPHSRSLKKALIELDVPEERIFPEDQATNTPENIAFSWQLIQEKFKIPRPKVIFVTSTYHCCRTFLTAEKVLGSEAIFAVTPTIRSLHANSEMFWEEAKKLFTYRAKGDL